MVETKDEKLAQWERELIYLLLHSKNALDGFVQAGYSSSVFEDPLHKKIVNEVFDLYDSKDVLTTRRSFLEAIKKYQVPKDRTALQLAFDRCYRAVSKEDDFHMLLSKVVEYSAQRGLNVALKNLKTNIIEVGRIGAIKTLIEDCEDVVRGVGEASTQSFYGDIRTLTKDRIQYFEDVRSGKIIEEPLLLCGIQEIDYTMVTGFEKGTLTIFCADVGGYKSSMMLNVGLNIWSQGHNVLFVPLEMHRDQMWRRMCAREARIDSKKITRNIKDLTDEDMEKIREMEKKHDESEAFFYMMEQPGKTTVSSIQRQIERNIEKFQPRLVVIDYVANLAPDRQRSERNDLEIGDMLKAMRQMGKTMNFAVVSAAQLGRDALKRIRKAGASKDKAAINSEDIRGSHEYAADADNIYAMLKHIPQPNHYLELFCVKSRNGPTIFKNEKMKALLRVFPEYGLITSQECTYGEGEGDPITDESFLEDMADKSADSIPVVGKDTIFDETEDWGSWDEGGLDDLVGETVTELEEEENEEEPKEEPEEEKKSDDDFNFDLE